MSATTYKNLIQRREHRERSQPAARARYGLLEKHKDYVLRARDFHSKEARLRALKRRAAMRNPDEFYYGMHSAKVEGGVHVKARPGAPPLTAEELALLKTQDAAYVQNVVSTERKRVERLEATLHGIAAAGGAAARGSHHLVFAEGDAEAGASAAAAAAAAAAAEDAAEPIDGCLRGAAAAAAPVGAKRSRRVFERSAGAAAAARAGPGDEEEEEEEDAEEEEEEEEDEEEGEEEGEGASAAPGEPAPSSRHVARAASAAYRELAERRARLAQLEKVLATMHVERQLQGSGARKKVVAATRDAPAVYKWKAERKR